jgi:cell shape-determining protein MreC
MRRHLRRKSDTTKITRLVVVVILVLLVSLLLPPAVRMVGAVVLYPVQLVENWLAQSSMVVPVLWRDKIAMQDRISELEQGIAESGRTDLTTQRLFEENNRLRELLGDTEKPRTLAVVVAKPTELPYDMLQIDRGSNSGIAVGAPVYIGTDSVIGLVSDVYATHSFVTLFTTPGFLATVYLTGPDVTATLEGLGGGVARVKMPQGIAMQIGDLVHVPSVRPGLYGQIAWIESEPTQPEQYGYITPNIPIKSLYQVAVGAPADVTTNTEEMSASIEQIKSDALLVSDLVLATSTATTTATSTATTTTEFATSTPAI